MNLKSLLTFFVSILLISSEGCENNIPAPKTELEKLPPATQEGKNTFGCLVNGKAWVTESSIDAIALYEMAVLQISAGIEEKDRDQGITLAILGGITQGMSYDLSLDPEYEAKFGWIRPERICTYDDDSTLSGRLTITKLDASKFIVAGEFEFITVVQDCDTIKVTDGRFDLTY